MAMPESGPVDAFEAPVAQIVEGAVELALQVVVRRSRDDDAAGVGELLEPGGDVDALAVEVAIWLVHHVAEIDPDAEADPLGVRPLGLALCRPLLQQDGAAHGVDDARELDERAVAHQLDRTPPVLGDQRLHEFAAQCLQTGKRAVLVALDERRKADHVGRHDGGDPALDPWRQPHLPDRRARAAPVLDYVFGHVLGHVPGPCARPAAAGRRRQKRSSRRWK